MAKNKYGQVAGAAFKSLAGGQRQAGDTKHTAKTKKPPVPISLNTSHNAKGKKSNTSARNVK